MKLLLALLGVTWPVETGWPKTLNALGLAILMIGCDNSARTPVVESLPTAPTAAIPTVENHAPTPTNPAPPPVDTTPTTADHSAFVWAMVIEPGGVCIAGATIEVVQGQRLGERIIQTTPCDAWAYDGGVLFRDLTPGVAMTLRASAPGYDAEEKIVIPSSGGQMSLLFTPSRSR